MKLLGLLFLIQTSIFGANLSIVGPCEETPAFEESLDSLPGESVGAYTIRFLENFKISYVGSDRGINSILNSPIGLDAMEVISDREMMAYGWCYSVNGVSPEVYPDEMILSENDEVLWWFGYAHYLEGEWITQCSPSYLRSSEFICK